MLMYFLSKWIFFGSGQKRYSTSGSTITDQKVPDYDSLSQHSVMSVDYELPSCESRYDTPSESIVAPYLDFAFSTFAEKQPKVVDYVKVIPAECSELPEPPSSEKLPELDALYEINEDLCIPRYRELSPFLYRPRSLMACRQVVNNQNAPLTMCSTFNSKNRYDTTPNNSFGTVGSFQTHDKQSIFEEEDELSREYEIGGYAPLVMGTLLSDKYFVIRKLGFGHFSTVWLTFDKSTESFAAVKVSKSDYDFVLNCQDEVKFLKSMDKFKNNRGYNRLLTVTDDFSFESPFGSHYCITFEPLGYSLYQLIVHTGQIGFPLAVIQKLALHLVEGAYFLHKYCGIIHTDIKPENVCINVTPDVLRNMTKGALKDYISGEKTPFAHANVPSNIRERLKNTNAVIYFDSIRKLENSRKEFLDRIWKSQFSSEGDFEAFAEKNSNPHFDLYDSDDESDDELSPEFDFESILLDASTTFKIIDLGTAQDKNNLTTDKFQTLQYRSPEAVLRHPITCGVDVWSIACVLYEAATGDYLFNLHEDRRIADACRAARQHFACFISILGSPPDNLHLVFEGNKIFNRIFKRDGTFVDQEKIVSTGLKEHILRHISELGARDFSSLLSRMLTFDPQQRSTAEDLLNDPFLTLPKL